MLASRLRTIGILLVAVGIAAHVMGWDTLLWFPRAALDSLMWAPAAIMDALQASPATTGVILLGVVVLLVAALVGRRTG